MLKLQAKQLGEMLMEEHGHSTGGRLCLEFTNTTSARDTDAPNEHLHSYADLLAWGEREGALPASMAAQLAEIAQNNPGAAAGQLRSAIELREALYRIFTAHADGNPPTPADLGLLNRILAQAMPHLQLVAGENGFSWAWKDDVADLGRMLWPVARSAADLLTSDDLGRVRECAGEHCNWLFIDRSKNHSRRWCDMQECGNVAKVRRYRSRKQTGA
jgi:predicted RNA-binding Zn ribbon-like protein